MGKRSRRYENEVRSRRCEICHDDVELEFYLERGDIVTCGNCGTEYLIRSLQPLRLKRIDEEQEG